MSVKEARKTLTEEEAERYANGEELTEKVLYEARVFITPGFIFGSNGDRYVRISLCAKEEKIKEALERVKAMKT